MAKKVVVKAAPKKAAPKKAAAPRKKAAAKSSELDTLEQRRNVQNFKNSPEGIAAINEMRNNKDAMIQKNVFFREQNKK